MKTALNSITALLFTTIATLLGGIDMALKVLLIFMAIDYVTGVISSIIKKTTSSKVGFIGILKKFCILLVVIVAVYLDRLTGNQQLLIRQLVCYFYISNEGISILENMGEIGIPLPDKLKEILIQLNKKDIDK